MRRSSASHSPLQTYWFVYKVSIIVINAHQNFPDLKEFRLLLLPSTSLKPKDSSSAITDDKERQQILTFKKLEPVIVD